MLCRLPPTQGAAGSVAQPSAAEGPAKDGTAAPQQQQQQQQQEAASKQATPQQQQGGSASPGSAESPSRETDQKRGSQDSDDGSEDDDDDEEPEPEEAAQVLCHLLRSCCSLQHPWQPHTAVTACQCVPDRLQTRKPPAHPTAA